MTISAASHQLSLLILDPTHGALPVTMLVVPKDGSSDAPIDISMNTIWHITSGILHQERGYPLVPEDAEYPYLVHAHYPMLFITLDCPAWSTPPQGGESAALSFCPSHTLLLDRPAIVLFIEDVIQFNASHAAMAANPGLDQDWAGVVLPPPELVHDMADQLSNCAADPAEHTCTLLPSATPISTWFAHYERIEEWMRTGIN